MFIIYDLIFLIVALIHLPIYLFKQKFHRGFLARLGFLPGSLSLGRPIWIHAVSVGEAQAVRGLIQELKREYPDKKIVISTVTATGNKIAQNIAGDSDFVTYLPLDFSFIVRSVVERINPCIFVIAETEIWPNLISYLGRKNIPAIIVNGRISDRSFGGYRIIKFALRPVLGKVRLFCVQTPIDAERLLSLGIGLEKIRVTGNMKFDQAGYIIKTVATEDLAENRALLRLSGQEKLWVCGSTHPGEEEIILSIYKNLLKEFSTLRLLIAPRHPERAKTVEKAALKFGLSAALISGLSSASPVLPAPAVFILDTIGQLLSFYRLADIVFVGGSLIRKGGHNILEPAALGKPVIFGPYMFNFRDIADLFIKSEAAIVVAGAGELENKVKYLLNHTAEAEKLNQRATRIIMQHKGATEKNLKIISAYLR